MSSVAHVSFSRKACNAMLAAFAETKTQQTSNDRHAAWCWANYMIESQGIAVYVPTSVTQKIADQVQLHGRDAVIAAVAAVVVK